MERLVLLKARVISIVSIQAVFCAAIVQCLVGMRGEPAIALPLLAVFPRFWVLTTSQVVSSCYHSLSPSAAIIQCLVSMKGKASTISQPLLTLHFAYWKYDKGNEAPAPTLSTFTLSRSANLKTYQGREPNTFRLRLVQSPVHGLRFLFGLTCAAIWSHKAL